MKKWKALLAAGAAAVAVMAAVTAGDTVRAKTPSPDQYTIPERVYFGELSGAGMTANEAAEKVEAYIEEMKADTIILSAGENSIETTVGEMGLEWGNPEIVQEAAALGKSGNLVVRYKAGKDLEHEDKIYDIAYTVDREKIAAVLQAHQEELNTTAVDGDLKRENGEFIYIPGTQGVAVNVEESAKAVEEFVVSQWNAVAGKNPQIELVADVQQYRGTKEEMALVTSVLGSYSTDYSISNAARSSNVANGAAKINGSVVFPGEQFSVYEVESPFTAENGWQLAGAYENGKTVESYGGGICQVSTTLYNAVIRAELEVVERYPHSMIVTYVDPSADAAIAGTYKDFKFINNTDAPIYIEGYTSNKIIYFTIYGHETREAGREVKFVSETSNVTDPGAKFTPIEAPIGVVNKVQSVHEGKSAKLWKIVTVNGVEQSREVFNTSNYSPSPAIFEVGVVSANPDAVANIMAAIETQDEATVRAVAAVWNDEALAAAALQQQQEQEQQQQEQEPEEQKPEEQEPEEQEPEEQEPTQESEANPD